MRTYKVKPVPWKHGWELHIDGVGVTQARSLREARAMAIDYISLEMNVPKRDIKIAFIGVPKRKPRAWFGARKKNRKLLQ